MSQINRNGRLWRPSWNHNALGNEEAADRDWNAAQLEMLESIRNAIETVGRSQMLQCDVAHALKETRDEIRGLRRDLKRKRRKK